MGGWAEKLGAPNRGLRRFGRRLDNALQGGFGAIGKFVANRPRQTMLACIIFTAICALGILRINVVTNGEELYTPQHNQAFDDRDYVEALYGYPKRQTAVYVTAPGMSGGNILTKPALLAFLDLYTRLRDVTSSTDGKTYTLESPALCFRPSGPNAPCDVISVLNFWGYSRDAIVADTDITATVSNTTAKDLLGRPITAAEIMGGIVRAPDGKITSVEAFQIKFTNQNNKPNSESSSQDDIVNDWEKEAVNVVNNGFKSADVSAFIASDYGQTEEESKAISSDIQLLIVGYVLLAIYGQILLAKRHPVHSSSWLGLMSILSVIFAVICSYGVCMAVGVNYSLVVQLLALLLLGLGTDDMLVTMAAHEETGKEIAATSSITDRVTLTVARARRGIIVATSTNLVAFATGASSELPALRDFMIYAVVGILFVLAFQSTWFVACLALDMKRQKANRVDWFCCFKSRRTPTQGCFGAYDPAKPSISQRVIGIWLPKVILHPVGKALVLIVTLGLAVFGAIGAANVKQDFNNDNFIPAGSYYEDVLSVRSRYFQGNVEPFGVYTRNLATPPLDLFGYQDQLASISTSLQANEYVAAVPPIQSWYDSYVTWLANSSHVSELSPVGRPQTSADFYEWLGEFLDGSGQRFKQDVIFFDPATRKSIRSSRINAYFRKTDNSEDKVSAMQQSRDLAKSSAPDLAPISYTFGFVFYEGFAVIADVTIREVLIAGSVVFVIMLALLADITAALVVGVMVAFVDLELVGFLHWGSLYFNSVTSINLLLAIGIAVDYSAFTAYAFLTATEGSRTDRAKTSLQNLGVAVFNGGFTMFLAIFPAVAATSYVFQVFFKMFVGIVLLGLWHGLFAVPVIMSLIGSAPYESALNSTGRVQSAGALADSPALADVSKETEMAPPPVLASMGRESKRASYFDHDY